MKRHSSRFRRSFLCLAVTRAFIAGLFILTSVAVGSTPPGIFIAGERGSTFHNSLLSGAPHGRFDLWNRWESVFRFGRPSLFGVEFLTAVSGFHHIDLSGLTSSYLGKSEESPPAALGLVKLSGVELRWKNGAKYPGRITAGKISMVQPKVPGLPSDAGVESEIVAIVDGSAEAIPLIASPVTESPSEEVADVVALANSQPPPARRPKPPLPPQLPIVSR